MSPNQTPSTPDEISRGPRVKNNNRKLLRTNSHCSLNGASGTGKKNRQTNKPTDAKPFRTDVFALGLDGRAGGPAQLPLRRRPPFPTQSAAFNATEVSRARRFAGSWFLGLHFRVFFSFAGRAPEGPLAFRPGQRRRIARDNRHEDHLRVLPLADVDRAHLYSFVSPSPLPAAGSRTKTRPDWSLGDTFGCRYCAYLYALLACKQRPIEKIVNKSVKVGKRLLRHATGMNRTNGRPVGTRYRVGEKEN